MEGLAAPQYHVTPFSSNRHLPVRLLLLHYTFILDNFVFELGQVKSIRRIGMVRSML